ncbi:uncharacterized protein FSUBG_8732 [Fusarium subglutinans]|uniref:Uncharacterized protein n=1 Tax=Gibberella subglutinans TaxID=42677 RepID=A0A8H5URV1_GIBSU|nr:uncharacterized protein FSUBG_8732 [Fusarium subglutinans]KAF5596777.1 hypothetical protein FSUBG_8732 [Fusarium subglutinans]
MCQLSSTATICESCRHLISYTSNKHFCPLVMNPVTRIPIEEMEDRACLEEPEDFICYVSRQFCKRCEDKMANAEVSQPCKRCEDKAATVEVSQFCKHCEGKPANFYEDNTVNIEASQFCRHCEENTANVEVSQPCKQCEDKTAIVEV